MSITGMPESDPVKVGVPVCDLVCGLYLALVPRNNKPVPPPVFNHDQLFGGTLTPCGNDKSCGEQ